MLTGNKLCSFGREHTGTRTGKNGYERKKDQNRNRARAEKTKKQKNKNYNNKIVIITKCG